MHDFTRNKEKKITLRQQSGGDTSQEAPQYRMPVIEGDCIGAVYQIRPQKNPKPQVTADVAQ